MGGAGLAVLHNNEMILNAKQQQGLFAGKGVGGSGSVTNVTINMPPGSNGAEVVNAIRRYEKTNGTSWRN